MGQRRKQQHQESMSSLEAAVSQAHSAAVTTTKSLSTGLGKVDSSFIDGPSHLVLLLPFTTMSLGVLPLCMGSSVTRK
jgi:hypothetical protein